MNDKELNRILRTNWSGANYSKRIWGNTRGLAKELKTQMTLAYLTGKNESEIAGELANKYATGAAYARRLVRTESAYVSGQAQAAADQGAGIDSYKIIATLDLRTSNICREMDGKEFAYKDMEVGVNYPPFHPFCRTTVLSELDDQNLGELKRRSRDPETGKVKTFPGDITYRRWYESEVANNPEALFAEQVAKHRGADLQQHERYLNTLGKKDVGTLSDFREKKYKTPEEYEDLKVKYREINGYNQILESENVITDMIQQVSKKLNVELAGFNKRIKEKDSYLEKMKRITKGKKDPKLIKKKIDNINDVIRYTFQGSTTELRKVFDDVVEEMEARGYKLKRVINTWVKPMPNSSYNGVNCTFSAPDGRHTLFEVQFHTPESFNAKHNLIHDMYKEMRKPETSLERVAELQKMQDEIFDALEMPMDVDKIKMHKEK